MEELITYFWDATHWQWLTLAMLLFAFEIILPTFFLLWPAVAALIVGGWIFFYPETTWQTQIIIFTVISMIVTVFGRRYFSLKDRKTDHPHLNQLGSGFIGRKVTLSEDLKDGMGRLSIQDTTWEVRAEDGENLMQGTKVEIISIEGATLIIKSI